MISIKEFTGEFIGTFILVLFGCGSVATTILFSAHHGLFQIALLWGIGVTLGIYTSKNLSQAHLNPAVSIAMVLAQKLSLKKLPNYLIAQFTGSMIAGVTLYVLFEPSINAFEAANNITRGSRESVLTAMIFGEFYPNPTSTAVVSIWLACLAEAFGTFLLVFAIFSLTETEHKEQTQSHLTPVLIGLTVTSIICLIAPLTQAGLNPARDFGPRLVSYIAGWGEAALPDPYGGFFHVYILSPIIGGMIATLFFKKRITPHQKKLA